MQNVLPSTTCVSSALPPFIRVTKALTFILSIYTYTLNQSFPNFSPFLKSIPRLCHGTRRATHYSLADDAEYKPEIIISDHAISE